MRKTLIAGGAAAAFVALGAAGITGGRAILQQAGFLASGAGAALRTAEDKLRDTISLKDFGAPCNGSSSDTAALNSAIGTLPSSGGTIDARSCTAGMSLGSSLTISKSGVTLLLPAATVALGSNQIIVAVGAHNVTITGPTGYGSPATATAAGCYLTYTGSGAAVQVGDTSADTNGFGFHDCSILLTGAGSAAIGVQLNRAVNFTMMRPRVGGLLTASTQKLIDLEGATNYTGGLIVAPYLSNGNVGIYFGKNANANTVISMQYAGLSGSSVGLSFAGLSGGAADGNTILGGDVENCLTTTSWDFANNNAIWGLRTENCTNAAVATANSVQNVAWFSGSQAMAVTDSGTNNSFTEQFHTQLGRKKWVLNNNENAASQFIIQSGLNATQRASMFFNDQGAAKWEIAKDSANGLTIQDQVSSVNRFNLSTTNNVYRTNTGGGHIFVYDGSMLFESTLASPAIVASIDGSGNLALSSGSTKSRGTITLAAGTGTATVASGTVCVCTDTTANASVKCAVSSTTLTATGTGTDVIAYHCF